MRVFSQNFRCNGDGSKSLQSVNCQLSCDEVRLILDGVKNLKPCNNNVFESIRTSLVFQIENFL